MITQAVILGLIALFQASFGGGDFILLILVTRSLIISDTSNFWLAFTFGLLYAFLANFPLGSLSLIYLLLLFLSQLTKKFTVHASWWYIFPFAFLLFALGSFLESFFLHFDFNLKNILLLAIFSLPIYLFLKFCQERFIPQKEIRLKL